MCTSSVVMLVCEGDGVYVVDGRYIDAHKHMQCMIDRLHECTRHYLCVGVD